MLPHFMTSSKSKDKNLNYFVAITCGAQIGWAYSVTAVYCSSLPVLGHILWLEFLVGQFLTRGSHLAVYRKAAWTVMDGFDTLKQGKVHYTLVCKSLERFSVQWLHLGNVCCHTTLLTIGNWKFWSCSRRWLQRRLQQRLQDKEVYREEFCGHLNCAQGEFSPVSVVSCREIGEHQMSC